MSKAKPAKERCQLYLMAFRDSWPRSCPTCGLSGRCVYGYRQEKRDDGFDIVNEGREVNENLRRLKTKIELTERSK